MNALYFPLYIAWSTTWLLVMVEYGRAAHYSWRDDGGRWADVPRNACRFVRWYLTSLGDDLVHWWRYEMPPIVEPGHSGRYLRLFVGMSALGSGVLGLMTSLVDRSAWPWWQHVIVFSVVALSLIAAQGHLALAWSRHPRRWRLFVFASAVWMPIGLFIRWRFL